MVSTDVSKKERVFISLLIDVFRAMDLETHYAIAMRGDKAHTF